MKLSDGILPQRTHVSTAHYRAVHAGGGSLKRNPGSEEHSIVVPLRIVSAVYHWHRS